MDKCFASSQDQMNTSLPSTLTFNLWPNDKTEKEFIDTYAADMQLHVFPPAGYNIESSNNRR